jgi:lysophospholipase L1-like esterase
MRIGEALARGSIPLKFALAIASAAAALLVTEGLLRIATSDRFGQTPFPGDHNWMAEDPILGFANRPDFVHHAFATNGRGFRGPPVRTDDPAETRIVCLGDSGTFGVWLDESEGPMRSKRIRYDNYPEELGRVLAERGYASEVVNAGVVGYTAAHGLRLLRARILDLEPDIVTFRFGLNDHKVTAANSGRLVAEPESGFLRRALYGFSDWRLLRLGLAAWRRADWVRPGADGEMVRMASPRQFEAVLRRVAALSRERGFDLLFVDYPLRPEAWGEHPHYAKVYRRAGHSDLASFHELHRRYQEVVRRVAAEEGVARFESADLLSDRADPGFGLLDFVHPNRRGAQLLAVGLADFFEASGWLPAPAATASGPRGTANAR